MKVGHNNMEESTVNPPEEPRTSHMADYTENPSEEPRTSQIPRLTSIDLSRKAAERRQESLSSRHPAHVNVEDYKILLTGFVGAGKSSYVNTLTSSLVGEIKHAARQAGDDTSVTKVFAEYPLKTRNKPTHIKIYDTMGLEEDDVIPIAQDIKLICKGHIMPGYKFQSETIKFDDDHYKKSPTVGDIFHLVVFVIDGSLEIKFSERLNEMKQMIEELDQIRCVVLLSKIDACSQEIDADLKKVFSNEAVCNKVCQVQGIYGFDTTHVFVGRNYRDTNENDILIDALALHNLESMLDLIDVVLEGNDTIPDLLSSPWRPDIEKHGFSRYTSLTKKSENSINILLIGPVESGKSSFINSCMSVVKERPEDKADTGRNDGEPYTMKFQAYPLVVEVLTQEVIFLDTMGITKHEDNAGMVPEDFDKLIDGRVPDKTPFKSNVEMVLSGASRGYPPDICIVVIDGRCQTDLTPGTISSSIQRCRKMCKEKGIPCRLIITHMDKICPHVDKDASHIYKSSLTRDCLRKVSEALNFSLAHTYCVANLFGKEDGTLDSRGSNAVLTALMEICATAIECRAERGPEEDEAEPEEPEEIEKETCKIT